MKPQNIATATLVPRLRGMLLSDIEALDTMIEGRSESKLINFLASLKRAKNHILKLLPDATTSPSGATTPTKNHLSVLKDSDATIDKDQVSLINVFHKLETEQMELVNSATDGKGLPDDLKEELKKVSQVYMSIVDQLGRAKSTQQINEIVVDA